MLFSKACEYAIKACVYTASLDNGSRKVNVKEISEKINAPMHFTAKILKQLSKAGIISSTKGIKGGFFFQKQQTETSLLELIIAVDGDNLFTACALGLSQCSERHPCPLHAQYGPIREELRILMTNNSIKSLAANFNSGQAFLSSIRVGENLVDDNPDLINN